MPWWRCGDASGVWRSAFPQAAAHVGEAVDGVRHALGREQVPSVALVSRLSTGLATARLPPGAATTPTKPSLKLPQALLQTLNLRILSFSAMTAAWRSTSDSRLAMRSSCVVTLQEKLHLTPRVGLP